MDDDFDDYDDDDNFDDDDVEAITGQFLSVMVLSSLAKTPLA